MLRLRLEKAHNYVLVQHSQYCSPRGRNSTFLCRFLVTSPLHSQRTTLDNFLQKFDPV